MDKYQSILDKISVLQKKASALQDTEKNRAIAKIRKLIELHNIQSAELFSGAKLVIDKPVTRKPVTARGKKVLPPKYRDPATGKTWNGHGKPPLWLAGVSDRERFLIAAQSEVTSDTVNPVKKVRGKAKRPTTKNSSVAKRQRQ
jgi:DNA-binding protein H-NS